MKNLVLKIIIAIFVVLILINFTAAKIYKLSAFEVELDVNLAINRGVTIIDFPPIGRIKADTHLTPVNLKLTLAALHQERLKQIINNIKNKQELINLLKTKGQHIIELFLIRLLIIAILGGTVGASIISLDKESMVVGIVVGVIIVLVFSISTYYSYDISEFNNPNFEGMLEAAPWMIGLIEEGLNSIDQLGYEMQLIASNMSQLFTKVDTLRPLSRVAGDLKVLHVSDIHNNPVALQFIIQIADSFGVDMIIDTGDITDYGTPLEAKLLEKINQLDIPYIFVAGNHDSPEIMNKMSDFSNVIVLKADVVNIKGLVVAGVADPAAKSNQIKPLKKKDTITYQQGLEQLVARLEAPPDIVAVHHDELVMPLLGKVPVVLHGHDHDFKIYTKKDTTIVDAGTTGGAGVRGFETEEGIPYSVALLHYNQKQQDNFNLTVVDIIKFYSRHSGFILERKLINNEQRKDEDNKEL